MQKVILVVFIVALFACVQSEQFCVKFSTYVFNNIEGVWDPIDDSCDAETLALSDANHEPHISRFTNVVAELKCDASTSQGQQVLNCLPLGQGSTMYFLSPYTNPPNDPRQFSYLYADYSDNHTFSYAKTTIEDVYDPLSDEPIPIGQSWKILYKSFLTRRRPNIPNFDAIEIQISLQPYLDTISELEGRPSLPVDETDAVECHAGNGFVQPPIVSVFINWGSTTGISCAWRGAAKAGPVERCIPQNNQGPGQQQQPVDPPLAPITVPVDPPVAPVDPPVAPVDPPVAPVDPPVAPVDPPVAPVDPPVAPVDPPVTPVDPPVAPVDPPVTPVDPPVAPVDPPVTPVDPPVAPVDPPVTPVDPPVTPVDPPVTPVDPPVTPVDPPVTPVDPPVTPVDPPVAPVDPPVAPVTPPVTAPVATPVASPVTPPVTPPVTTNEPEQQPEAPTPIFAQPDGMEPPVDEPEPEPVSTPDGPIYLPGRCRPKKKDLKSTECPNKPGWHGPDCGCYVKPELECVQKLKLGRWQFYRAFFGYRINCIAGARVPEYIVQNLGPRNRGSPSSVITRTLLRVFCTKGRRYRAQWSVDWDGNTDLVWAIGRAGRDAVSTVGAKKCDSLSHAWGRNWWSWFAHGDHKRAIEFEDLGDLGGHQQRFVKSSTDIAPGQVTTAYLLPESNQLFTGHIKSCSQMTVKIQSSAPIDFIVSTEVGSYTSRTEIKTGSSWPTAFVTATVPFDDEGSGSDWNLAVTAPESNVAVFINVHCIDDGSLVGSASALSGSFFALFALALCLLALLF